MLPSASLVLVYRLLNVVKTQISNKMDGFVSYVCHTETVTRNAAPLETSPKLSDPVDGGSHIARFWWTVRRISPEYHAVLTS